jgi:thiol-disulfide isomerase/thioredoxin
MKIKLYSSLSILLLVVSIASSAQQDYVFLSGKIDNPNTDSIMITNNIVDRVFKLNSNNEFSGILKLKEGYYFIFDGRELTPVYLKLGDSLNVTLNTKQFDETVHYTGTGAIRNNYLAKKALFRESFMHINNPMSLARLDEKLFLKTVDSISSLQLAFLDSFKHLSNTFVKQEKKSINSERLNAWANYQSLKRFFTENKKFEISDNFPDFASYVKLDDHQLSRCFEYNSYLNTILTKQFIEVRKKSEQVDWMISFLNYLDTIICDKEIKDEFLMSNYHSLSRQTRKPHIFHKRLLQSLSFEEYKEYVTKEYIKTYKLKSGDKSPDFSFKNIKNETVHLSDFKGKIVYIDIWATWCQPCIKEQPELEQLIQEYKEENITFISISKGDTFEDWIRYVKQNDLKGIQLFAKDEHAVFFNEYFVNSIPRFILINENGVIISPNALRPSNSQLKEHLDNILESL